MPKKGEIKSEWSDSDKELIRKVEQDRIDADTHLAEALAVVRKHVADTQKALEQADYRARDAQLVITLMKAKITQLKSEINGLKAGTMPANGHGTVESD